MAPAPTAGPDRPTRRLGRALAAAVLVLVLAGCESDQDPGLDTSGVEGTDRTSDTLGTCPAGGPDATTPTAGCLGPGGSVLRP